MNKILLISFLLFLTMANAQKMYVTEFKEANSIEARLHLKKDKNGEKCAIIKINSALEDLRFDSSYGITEVEYKNGEYWVYISPAEVRIEVFTKGYEKLKYQLPISIKELTTYEMIIRVDTKIVKRREMVLPGFVVINSVPQGATVYINGKNTSMKTPFQKSLSMGKYQITLKKDLYQSVHTQVKINQEGETKKLNLKLLPLFTSLAINSSPQGAEIMIDSKPTGKITPHTFTNILKGKHTIKVEKTMYEFSEKTIDLQKQEDLNFQLKPLFGTLQIQVNTDADIYIDKVKVGTTSISKKLLEGMCFIEIKKEGYFTKSYKVDVLRGKEKRIDVKLIAKKGILKVTSIPFDAEVYINNNYLGTTPLIQKHSVGKYDISIRKEGYAFKNSKIFIKEDKQTVLEEKLEKKIWYSPSRKRVILASAILPGWGRYIAKEDKSIMPVVFYTGVFAAAVGATIYTKISANKHYTDYKNHYNYKTSFKKTMELYKKYVDTLELSNGLMYASMGIYILNLLEALFLEIEPQKISRDITLRIMPIYNFNSQVPMLSFNLKF